MEYKIYCKDAKALVDLIFSCFKKNRNGKRVKLDPRGVEIETWDYTTTDKKVEVLIHTTQQWEDIGNIHLDASENNEYVVASFHYWTEWLKEHDKENEEAYYLGRLTELILVHFYSKMTKLEIL